MKAQRFWIGGYTSSMQGEAEGIGMGRMRADGSFEYLGLAGEASSPSALVTGPGVLYATDEATGRVAAFRVGASRGGGEDRLTPLGSQPTSGQLPCQLSIANGHLLVANYLDGSVDVFPLDDDGLIRPRVRTLQGHGSGPHAVQAGPHAHATLVRGNAILVADLGADRIHSYSWAGASIVPVVSHAVPAGSGPRDFAVSDGIGYLLGELDGAIYRLGAGGEPVASGTMAADWQKGDHAAGLVTFEGFAYSGLRGSNRIAVASLADLAPVAELSCGGNWPRHLAITGDVLLVANQLSSTVTSFRLDPVTGIPRKIGDPEPVPSPTFLIAAR